MARIAHGSYRVCERSTKKFFVTLCLGREAQISQSQAVVKTAVCVPTKQKRAEKNERNCGAYLSW